MLYAIFRGNVPACPPQSEIIHLVSFAEDIAAAGLPFVFTDGHGIMEMTSFFDSLADLTHIDWAVMRDRYWADTPEDNDRSRRRQAEFLVHDFMPWNLITSIGVASRVMHTAVTQVLAKASHKPIVGVQQRWYYSAQGTGA